LERAGPAGGGEQRVAVGDRHRLAEARLLARVLAVAVPHLLAGLRVIAPHAQRPVQHEIDAARRGRYQTPGAEPPAPAARGRPLALAGLPVEGDQGHRGGLLARAGGQCLGPVVVAVLDDEVLEEEGRRGRPPAGLAGEGAEGVLPEELAVAVVAEQARGAE